MAESLIRRASRNRSEIGKMLLYALAHRPATLRTSVVNRALGLLVLLVVASGCSTVSAPGGSAATETAPITPAPVPETDTQRYPSWAPAGEVNVTSLLDAQNRTLTDGYTVTVVWNRTVEERDMDIRRLTVRSKLWMGNDRYRLRTAAAIHRDTASYDVNPANAIALRLGDGTDVYADRGIEFVRRDDGEAFERRTANRSRYDDEFRVMLADLLQVTTTRVQRVNRNGEQWYRVEGSGQTDDDLASDYRLRAFVSPDGVVRELHVDYLLGRSTVSVRVQVTPGAAFDPPEWLPDARDATSMDTETAS